MSSPLDRLVPRPRKLDVRPGAFSLDGAVELRPPPGFASPALDALRAELQSQSTRLGPSARAVELVLDGRSGHPREGYGMTIEPERVRIVASKGVGLNHGMRTLLQLVRAAEREWITTGPLQEPGSARAIPALSIEDAPAFERRGVMLDVSRDRVPRMDYLFQLVEQLAEWKLNELQLYFEHAFAYRAHERVWRGIDPFTHDEVRALDRHCKAHGIELVPNQQSFGHLHHWLKHPEYRHLAEVPEGIVHPFLGAGETGPEPYGLCPTDPRTLEFLGGLYDELLPCFSSGELNVGLDETIDLGPGRSAAAIREKGVGRVYLDFLRSVHGLAAARGRRMQFWADIVLSHPELVREVPKDSVACVWGYEADHPFDEEARAVAEAGLPFYVCPGTSSWLSIGGRTDNMLANVRAAARAGVAHGARGLLVCDWGDRGHLQPPSVGWLGFKVAAELAWNPESSTDHWVGIDAVQCESALAGNRFGLLGRLPRRFGLEVRNGSALSTLLTKFDAPFPPSELSSLDEGSLRRAIDTLADLRGRSEALAMRESAWAAALLHFACSLGLARLDARDGRPLGALDARARLADELAPLIAEHRSLWLERSRPGGLDRSARWLERVLEALRGS